MSTAFDDHGWSRDPADYWADPGYLRELDARCTAEELASEHHPDLDDTSPLDGVDPDEQPSSTLPVLPVLPDGFWDARPYLKHIRLAAHSRGRRGSARRAG